MKNISLTIPIGLGDIIYLKAAFDNIKHNYDKIKLNFNRSLIVSVQRNNKYNNFLDDIGQLFFSNPPYILADGLDCIGLENFLIYSNFGIPPQKPELGHLLCKGIELDIKEEYIVLITKLRYFPIDQYKKYAPVVWEVLKRLSKKFKIVVLGERKVEMNLEYLLHTSNHIYSIYQDIISNISTDRLLDLTIPALGVTSPTLIQIQQDCLIMKKAKVVITLGIGGGFCMATAVANTIGFRVDDEKITDVVFNKTYSNAMITKDFNKFISELQSYL